MKKPRRQTIRRNRVNGARRNNYLKNSTIIRLYVVAGRKSASSAKLKSLITNTKGTKSPAEAELGHAPSARTPSSFEMFRLMSRDAKKC